MDEIDKSKSIDIFTGTIWETRMVQSLLTDAGIESYVRDSSLGTFLLDPVKSANCKVLIMEKDEQIAKLIVEEYYKNISSEDPIEPADGD